tara:strand:+ start:29537 stop:30907 length:1371 start_codon:yes stop_codon:yes gene_type:complete
MCNGEIYNHKILKQLHDIRNTQGESDCEVVHHMLVKNQFINLTKDFQELDGDFSLIVVSPNHTIAARDPMGVRPLYVAYNKNDSVIGFASEAKSFLNAPIDVHVVKPFPPGYYWINNTFVSYQPLSLYKPIHQMHTDVNIIQDKIKGLLYNSVYKRIQNSERSVAFFLSGGLDSSIIASIASKILQPNKIDTYSIGTPGSPDLIAAQQVADHIQSNHHVIEMMPEEMYKYVYNTINHIESYDCTTVRASVPMFILSEYISKHTNHKVVLSGEGADELFGGYLYFHHAPDDKEFQKETLRLLQNVHMYDVLRADRCTSAHGLELRVPFFDKYFVEYVISIDPSLKTSKGRIEKKLLRDSFADHLPATIIHRQKNGMSDAVGYDWVDYIKSHANPVIHNKLTYIKNTPISDEELYYREIFESMYGRIQLESISDVWRPQWTTELDPSARKLSTFLDSA